jgi:predicted ATPase
MNAVTTYQLIGDHAGVSRLAARLGELADKFNLPPQRSAAAFMAAWNSASLGDPRGLQVMEDEFARVSVMGPLPPYYSGLLASIRLQQGEVERALEPLDAVLRSIKEPGVGFFVPEIHRLRGECLLRLDPANFDEAQRELRAAIATAKQQQARMFELRAAISLLRVWAAQGAHEKAIAALTDIVGSFGAEDGPAELTLGRQLLADPAGDAG